MFSSVRGETDMKYKCIEPDSREVYYTNDFQDAKNVWQDMLEWGSSASYVLNQYDGRCVLGKEEL